MQYVLGVFHFFLKIVSLQVCVSNQVEDMNKLKKNYSLKLWGIFYY